MSSISANSSEFIVESINDNYNVQNGDDHFVQPSMPVNTTNMSSLCTPGKRNNFDTSNKENVKM